jgi:hypothetical protein
LSQFKKLILYSGLALTIIIVGLAISIFLFKDRILQEFITEANKSLNTPVKIEKIEISAWRSFPNLAIEFTNVYVEDSHPEEFPLLTAEKVSFYINLLKAARGQYIIQGLQIRNSKTSLKVDKKGENNFTIAKGKGDTSTISFDLKNVKLLQTVISYEDLQADQHHIFTSEKLISSIAIRSDVYKIEATGDVTTNQLKVGHRYFLKEKKFILHASVNYDDVQKIVSINTADLQVNKSIFGVSGQYAFKKKNAIDLKIEGKETDVQTLVALLPDELSTTLRQYESNGNVFFSLHLAGEISKQKDPFLSIHFGCKEATFFHPAYQSKITHANLEGSFASPSLSQFSQAQLFLKNMSGQLNGKAFTSNLAIQNPEDPTIQFDFKGELDAASLQNFYPLPDFHQLQGTILADFSVAGETRLLKVKATAQQVKTSGTIELKDVQFNYGKQKIKLNDLNGVLQFNNNDLAMSNLNGRFENSDFELNGFFKNVITFLLFEDQPIGIEADLKANYLDVDQLFKIGFGGTATTDYKFSISRNLQLHMNCDVKKLTYKRFHPRNLKGDLLIKNQMAVSRNISMKTMGGSLQLNGIVDAKNPKTIDIVSSFKLDGIYIDSVFYVFENFYQTFVQDKHLKGQAFADVNMEMTLGENLRLISKTLTSDISVTIKNGELNNFEPLQGLNKYIDDETLNKLRFADLKNDIHIENETIYIPRMEIKSNATTIQLSGTHTFDQHILYRVSAPLRNKKKVDPDEAFGAIEESGKGQTKLFLKIAGTTDQYKISYDKEAVKNKIVSDLKKEIKELKEAFQLKGKKKKKEIELEKADYLDWDN